MSIATYADLKASVANYLNRSDLTSIIPDLITLAEARLNADLRARDMEARTSLSATAGNAYVTLPTDMLEMQRLAISSIDPMRVLKYLSADELATDYPSSSGGMPAVFAIIGAQIQLAPIPDSDYTLELSYQQRVPALSDTNSSNWLLSAWPNAYLYATLCEAQPFLMNDARLQVFQALYQQAVDGINQVNWYSGSTMRVKTR